MYFAGSWLCFSSRPEPIIFARILWLRLPFQAVFAAWVWWVALQRPLGIGAVR
jgi:hypothetical protein